MLGDAFAQALGDKRGIRRYGEARCRWTRRWRRRSSTSPGGRTWSGASTGIAGKWVGGFDAELAHEFFQAFTNRCQCNLHLRLHYGQNAHHILEALWKAFARATADAARDRSARRRRRAVDEGDADRMSADGVRA